MISKHLNYSNIIALGINENIIIPLTEANKNYLSYHREHIFKKRLIHPTKTSKKHNDKTGLSCLVFMVHTK